VIGDDLFADIAVLKINQTDLVEEGYDFVPLPIANSSTIRVGEPVVAIGYPFATSLGPKSTLCRSSKPNSKVNSVRLRISGSNTNRC
jgi:S1-C subfamily serine protease